MRGSGGCGQGAAPVRAAAGRREVALRAGMLGIPRIRSHPFGRCVHSVRRARPARNSACSCVAS
ncbi:hypothetical protein GTY87_38200 [Streptomyces sp. SID7813]|uniref:Uncharacterized protein n=1 Tax=Streptomyces lividans 1326 TaxID=1200984 RepID=A0A7U9DYA9_STRLI|nr:predicted protein [Streptomyces lividans TK24]EOY52396.1 hypothetical protein SLI_7696 [Streptomyces lividans 1326]MYU46981.1 hypothetical protein [Streptomyces sp. SID7813]NSL80197.1 hypothetical protein [Streptomyces coelicolor]QFI47211.1 hypothetical protein FQ762_38555 [Streptomyces coelicolor A3(2)]THA87389.1 hypothetical protein E6R61_29920 [Streptomyces sp. LRa12]